MSIDNTSCITAINHIKSYVSACFAKCTAKGSTFSGTQKLANLETAIDLIPTGSGGDSPVISENITGGSFDLFTVTKPDEISPNEFTIDFGVCRVININFNTLNNKCSIEVVRK